MEQTPITESEGRQPQHTHCMRCHRALKNTRSRGIGFGPICERKAVPMQMQEPSRNPRRSWRWQN